ncbi:MAG TPA: hypothetical protein VIX87_03575 [Steroidobacteraceae bacterium]
MKGAPSVLTLLDAPSRADHAYISASDRCAFLGQYLTGGNCRAGCNQLIRSFKCEPSVTRNDYRRKQRKQQAIATLAQWLRRAVTREEAEHATWVPIPPSRGRGDPDFDDRLSRTLALAFAAYDVDVRELLYQIGSTVPDHAGQERLRTSTLYEILRLDLEALRARPIRERIALFDDVLTTGKHYKCCERRLREALPSAEIAGIFLVRRALPGRWRGLG